MQSHNLSDSRMVENINSLFFAKELFLLLDKSGKESLKFDELSTGLVSFGVSSDPAFIKKILFAANPSKFCDEKSFY